MLKHSLYAVALIVATLAAPAFFPQEASAGIFNRSARVGGYGYGYGGVYRGNFGGGYGGIYRGGYRPYGAVGVYNRGFVGNRGGLVGGRYYR